jgi:hypothetical protein
MSKLKDYNFDLKLKFSKQIKYTKINDCIQSNTQHKKNRLVTVYHLNDFKCTVLLDHMIIDL